MRVRCPPVKLVDTCSHVCCKRDIEPFHLDLGDLIEKGVIITLMLYYLYVCYSFIV